MTVTEERISEDLELHDDPVIDWSTLSEAELDDYVDRDGHEPLAQGYRDARRAFRVAELHEAMNRADRARKYGSEATPIAWTYASKDEGKYEADHAWRSGEALPVAPGSPWMDADDNYRDPVVTPVKIRHAVPGHGGTLDEVLEGMTGFDTVVDDAIDMRAQRCAEAGHIHAAGEACALWTAVAIAKMRRVIENARAKARADECCRFDWNDDYAQRGLRYQRGRVSRGRLLKWGGETWNVCTTKSRAVADGPLIYTVFVRSNIGSEVIVRHGKKFTAWTWEYHRYQRFGDMSDALDFQDQLTQLFDTERELAETGYEWMPGGVQPYDPVVLQGIVEGTQAHEAHESTDGWDRQDWVTTQL